VRAGEVEAVGVVAVYCGDDTVSREGVRLICGVIVRLSAGFSTATGLSWVAGVGVVEGSSLMEVMGDCCVGGARDCCH
jgi:hypothetical protein